LLKPIEWKVFIIYYPIQIPYILSQTFSKNVKYSEHTNNTLDKFVICFWEMQTISGKEIALDNIIVTDGCIDLICDYTNKIVGFSGMSETNFQFKITLPVYFFGARLMPGAFYQLTGLPASSAMDVFLPIEEVFPDFYSDTFFSLPFPQFKINLENFLAKKIIGLSPNTFTLLFNKLENNPPSSTKDLYKMLNLSPRQCQRLFRKHYGITPKMVLNIIRFQKCLKSLTSSNPNITETTGYYDQSHFINNFKRNLGITPSQLIQTYQI